MKCLAVNREETEIKGNFTLFCVFSKSFDSDFRMEKFLLNMKKGSVKSQLSETWRDLERHLQVLHLSVSSLHQNIKKAP